jgi:hypothetical protein
LRIPPLYAIERGIQGDEFALLREKMLVRNSRTPYYEFSNPSVLEFINVKVEAV